MVGEAILYSVIAIFIGISQVDTRLYSQPESEVGLS